MRIFLPLLFLFALEGCSTCASFNMVKPSQDHTAIIVKDTSGICSDILINGVTHKFLPNDQELIPCQFQPIYNPDNGEICGYRRPQVSTIPNLKTELSVEEYPATPYIMYVVRKRKEPVSQ